MAWNDPQRRPPHEQPTTAYGAQPLQGGRPGYNQGYGPGYQQGGPNPFGTEGNEQFGIVGMVMGLLGGVLLIVCFTALDWFSIDYRQANATLSFGDVGDLTDQAGAATGFAAAYFGWFAWTFAIVAVLSAVGSSFPSPALRAARVLGVVTAFAAAGLSFLALQVTENRSYLDWLKDARAGFYLAIIGFVLVGIGAAIGPRKV